MECYYGRKNNSRMYGNPFMPIYGRGMRGGLNRVNTNNFCMREENTGCGRCRQQQNSQNRCERPTPCGEDKCEKSGWGCQEKSKPCCENKCEKPGCGCKEKSKPCDDKYEKSGCGCKEKSKPCDDKYEKSGCGCKEKSKPCDDKHEKPGCGCDKEKDCCYPCKKDEWKESPIGMTYVPWQCFRMLMNMEKGFQIGTVFEELDKPFEIGFCARGCRCQ
ncbi:MAG: spore coat associated protein CotJA [Candidatus Fimimorpha sp.]